MLSLSSEREEMEGRGGTRSEPNNYHCKIWFECFLWALQRQWAWKEGVERDGFVQECWYVENIRLKGNNRMKPLEKCVCWTWKKEVVGLFSVLVSSCNGRPCNLLRQVAWVVVAAAALGAEGRLINHIDATHGKDWHANQRVGAQEWAVAPLRFTHLVPGLTQFPSCSELWHKGEEWRGRDFVPPLWTPRYVQGLCRIKVLK